MGIYDELAGGGEKFVLEELVPVEGYDSKARSVETFETAFTFPASAKTQVTRYLKKHKAKITAWILRDALEEWRKGRK